jgi:hypothetical protein
MASREDHSSLIRTSSEEPSPSSNSSVDCDPKPKAKKNKGKQANKPPTISVQEEVEKDKPLAVSELKRDGGYVNLGVESTLKREAEKDSNAKRSHAPDYHYAPRRSLVDANLVENYFESRRQSDDLKWRRMSAQISSATSSGNDDSSDDEGSAKR